MIERKREMIEKENKLKRRGERTKMRKERRKSVPRASGKRDGEGERGERNLCCFGFDVVQLLKHVRCPFADQMDLGVRARNEDGVVSLSVSLVVLKPEAECYVRVSRRREGVP